MTVRKLLLWLILLPVCCFAQSDQPLKQLFEDLAARHHVRFSYIDEELVVYRLEPPAKEMPLEEKLDYITRHTRLMIKQVTQGYYMVYNDKRMDKPLCGYLIDAQTGKPIENAAVSTQGVTVSSDAQGYFELPELTPHDIQIKHLSYQGRVFRAQALYRTDCPQIALNAVAEVLQEVVAERYLATGISKEPSGSVVVRPGKFGILPGLTDPDILQAMQQVPGIGSIDETVSNINVRGGTHDQNLFLWNGIRVFQTGHFFGLMSAFNPLLATKITLSKNGSSAFFGESVSSLVDVSSHTSVRDSCYHVIGVDMLNANFYSKIRLSKNATLLGSGRRTFTDIFTSPTFRRYQDRVFQQTPVTDWAQAQTARLDVDTDFYFFDFSLQYHQVIGDRHELIVDGIGIENSVIIEEAALTGEKESDLKQRNFGGSIQWKTNWDARHQSEIQAHVSWYDLHADSEDFTAGQMTWQRNRVTNGGLRLRHTYLFGNHSVGAGYQFDAIELENADAVNEPSFSRQDKQFAATHVGVVEGTFASDSGKRLLNVGLRGNYFEKFGLLRIEPRLAFTQVLSSKVKLEVLAEQKSQSLSQVIDRQQDFLGIEKRRWVLANQTNVPLQKSTQASLGLTYQYNRWLVTLDNFYKRVSGITAHSQGFRNQFEYTDALGEYRVLGSELLVQKSFKRFYSWISYSYNHNRCSFDALAPEEFRSNFDLTHAVAWAGTYEWKRLRVAIGTKWHTGAPFTAPQSMDASANTIVYDRPNNQNLGDYFQVNVSASHRWDWRGMRLVASGSVLNVLDHQNVLARFYRINTANGALEQVDVLGLGATVNAGLKVYF